MITLNRCSHPRRYENVGKGQHKKDNRTSTEKLWVSLKTIFCHLPTFIRDFEKYFLVKLGKRKFQDKFNYWSKRQSYL